ncbi:VOC family protein [Kordiimonas laminariae]|uniref:VOC family protein n=1 Tax=Kordiimonas laminariae TaxID=2917717 RepID=UPI001FF64F72|nr:VOC family protein [Kordiimonas laminariae]MCK0068225.1 VOC family protein [Kordiimonas laminariae]
MKAILAAASIVVSSLIASPVVAQEKTEIVTKGVNHLGLAVRDLKKTAAFFTKTLGWKEAGGRPDYPAIFVTDGSLFLTLWQVEDPATATPFDRRKNVGLHHLAITVNTLEDLDDLHAKFQKVDGVEIEFAPEFLGNGPTTHMMIREPSGVRLEFIVPGGKRRGQ